MSVFDVDVCNVEWLRGYSLGNSGFERPHIDDVNNGVAHVKLDRSGQSPCIVDYCRLKEIDGQIDVMKSEDSLWISPLKDSFEHGLSFPIESTKRITYGNRRWKIKHEGAVGLNFKAPIIGVYGTSKIKDCNFDCDYFVIQTDLTCDSLKFENFKCTAQTLIIESPNTYTHRAIRSSLDTYVEWLLRVRDTTGSIPNVNCIILYVRDSSLGSRLYDKYMIIHRTDLKIEDLKEHKNFNNNWMTGYAEDYGFIEDDRDWFVL